MFRLFGFCLSFSYCHVKNKRKQIGGVDRDNSLGHSHGNFAQKEAKKGNIACYGII